MAFLAKPQASLVQASLKTQTHINTLVVTPRRATSIALHKPTRTRMAVAGASSSATASVSPKVVVDRLNNHNSPWLMLPPEEDKLSGKKLDCFYCIADGTFLRLKRKKSGHQKRKRRRTSLLQVPETANCFGSTAGSWLAFVDTKDGSLYLSNPFINRVVELPSLEFLPTVVGVEREFESGPIQNFKVDDPGRCSWDDSRSINDYSIKDPKSMAEDMISHLALSCEDPRYPHCVAMAVQGETKRVAYCAIGKDFNPDYEGRHSRICTINDGTFWNGLQEDYFPGCSYNQVVYSSKKSLFYTLFDDCGIQAYDVEHYHLGRKTKKLYECTMKCLRSQLDTHYKDDLESESLKAMRRMCESKYYLVTLCNSDVLLIVRHYLKDRVSFPPCKTLHFDVFKVTYPGTLERIRSLENRAIFVGRNQSFCIDAYTSPGISPNSIHFTDDISLDWGHDMGIFTLNDGVIRPCYTYQDGESEDVPFTKPLFWVAPVTSHHFAWKNDLTRNVHEG